MVLFQFAGLIQDIIGDIDPSGRTDLLKIIDRAKVDFQNFSTSAIIKLSLKYIFFSNKLILNFYVFQVRLLNLRVRHSKLILQLFEKVS